MPINSKNAGTLDALLIMKDAGAVTSSAAAQVAAADRIIKLGAGRVDGRVIVDVTALDITTGDESYRIRLQLSTSATFAAGNVTAVTLELGDSTVTGSSVDSTVGRYELPFCNEVNGVLYAHARLFTFAAGTTPSINYAAYIALDG
jgi:hypothetical protein